MHAHRYGSILVLSLLSMAACSTTTVAKRAPATSAPADDFSGAFESLGNDEAVGLPQSSLDCPAGTELSGSEPPMGNERYCARRDGATLVKQGPAVEFYPSGAVLRRGQYVNDKKEGRFVGWHETGEQMEIAWYKAGNREGVWTLWLADGTKKFEGQYKNDLMDGLVREYDDKGQLLKQVEHRGGRKYGKALMWFADGKRRGEAEFVDDQLSGTETFWYPNGKIQKVAHYREGLLDGLVTQYTEQGVKRTEGIARMGKLEGLVTLWDEQGRKVTEVLYHDDKPVSSSQ